RLKGNEVLDQRVEKHLFEARMQIWTALATGDQGHWPKFEEAMKLADERLEALAKNDPERQAQLQQLSGLFKKYMDSIVNIRSLRGQNDALNAPEAKAMLADAGKIASEIATLGETLAAEVAQAAESTE